MSNPSGVVVGVAWCSLASLLDARVSMIGTIAAWSDLVRCWLFWVHGSVRALRSGAVARRGSAYQPCLGGSGSSGCDSLSIRCSVGCGGEFSCSVRTIPLYNVRVCCEEKKKKGNDMHSRPQNACRSQERHVFYAPGCMSFQGTTCVLGFRMHVVPGNDMHFRPQNARRSRERRAF